MKLKVSEVLAAGIVAPVGEARRNRAQSAGAILDVLEEPSRLAVFEAVVLG